MILPIFDLPTRSSSGFLLRYILPRSGTPPLVGPMARNPFISLVINSGDLIIESGHGSPDEITGQGGQVPVWKIGQYNPDLIKGKVVKLVSCECGLELCQDFVDKGALCAMGYDADLLWVADESCYLEPWRDELAAKGMLPIIAGLNALLDGATCQEAMDVEKEGYWQAIMNTNSPIMQSILGFNYNHGVIYGDGNARIAPRPKISVPFPPPPMLF